MGEAKKGETKRTGEEDDKLDNLLRIDPDKESEQKLKMLKVYDESMNFTPIKETGTGKGQTSHKHTIQMASIQKILNCTNNQGEKLKGPFSYPLK